MAFSPPAADVSQTDVPTTNVLVAALYRFCRLVDPEALRVSLASFCCGKGIKGTLLLAPEGINGTVAGTADAIRSLVGLLGAMPEFAGLDVKYSYATTMPFQRMKVKLKREIVTMGVEGIDPPRDAGAYVSPADWNALIADPDTLVIDTRNDYEVAIGTFERAIDPNTATFSNFPAWVARHRDELAGRKVAMFCTGGIRCEKATAYVKSLGVADVFHLKGGILKYLEDVPATESLWRGDCFVFDERVSVSHALEPGDIELCRACRRPVTAPDKQSPHYRAGISCARCHEERSDADRARYAERQRQMECKARLATSPSDRPLQAR